MNQPLVKDWHIMNVFEDRVECSCGKVIRARSDKRLGNKAKKHGRSNAPAMAISRRGCSDLCVTERMIRDIHHTFHDIDCPNHQEKRESNGS